jgi:gamma-glutamyl hercynylcysteine S-oxide synthase
VTSRETLVLDLTRARERTLRLVDFDDAELSRQYDPLMSPLVWDLAHIGQQEELWLLRGGHPDRPGRLPQAVDGLYDAFVHSRASRVELPLLAPDQARAYCRAVRSAALDALDALPDEPEPDPMARLLGGPPQPVGSAESPGSFVFGMVVSHENQHDETMLQALNLRPGPPLLPETSTLPPGRPGVAGTSVLVPGGSFVLGVDAASEPFSLDNERPAHVVNVPTFRIGRVPVTNAEWRQFIDDGGYAQPRWWSTRGWEHRQRAGLTAPQFWGADGYTRTRFGRVEDIPAEEPVQHVTYFEAEAYAAWAGARLPTETEWEKACAWDPQANARRRHPWGAEEPSGAHANLGGAALRPAPVGAYPDTASAYGAEQMLGDVWEWTSSPLRPWPGFTPMIYQRYSQPFFGGDYQVLRGGSWAVEASILRPSFRNWDHPYRRQIFSGVRLAWSVESVEDNSRPGDPA